MSQQIITEFESRFLQNFLHQQAMIAINGLELSEDSVENVINILIDMGFGEYIITNTFKLELDETKYLQYASKMLELFNIQEELVDILGYTTLNQLTKTSQLKAEQWLDNSMDEFIDRLYA
jgi:hypothetical protein